VGGGGGPLTSSIRIMSSRSLSANPTAAVRPFGCREIANASSGNDFTNSGSLHYILLSIGAAALSFSLK
jgi:hypothetical protein